MLQKFTPCTNCKCNSNLHSADKCYFLHPELRLDAKKVTPSKKAHVAVTTETIPIDNSGLKYTENVEELRATIAFMTAQLAAQNKEVVQSNNILCKPIYVDSGNNYSVLSSTNHKDTNSEIIVSYSKHTLETAGGHQLAIEGYGQMKELPAVYVPTATASLLSVQQFCEK